MRHLLTSSAVTLLTGVVLLGCSAKNDAQVSAPATSIETPTPDGGGALVAPINAASSQSCTIDRQMVETAVEIYFSETGTYPPSEAELVTLGYFDKESDFHDVLPDGTVIDTAACSPQPGQL